ncbi:hypothetical protein V2G26_011984 [Clonostachys chloroleuca]|uniref:Uncharacterized protein n=1 Tax=Clonostachys chloroleuca TaxID=1926264 RepID=A0AA35LVZ1_9HYPO|nr:unnamed protein product [Clonostachys chloroleuca]
MRYGTLSAEAYVAAGGAAAILGFTIAAAIATVILAIIAFFKTHQLGDDVRIGVPWLKAAGGLGSLWLILAIVSPVAEYLIRRARPTHGDTLAYDLGIQQFSILTNLLMYGAYATLLVAQLEFSIGLRRVSILLREQKVSGFFEEASRAPHVAGVAAFLVALIISVGDVVCTELYYSGIKAAFLPMQVTALSLHATLCIFSIGTLIYTASQSREVPHTRIWALLVALNSIAAVRHGGLTILRTFYSITATQSDLAFLPALLTFVQLIFGSWTFVICLGIAYGGISLTHAKGGLWTRDPLLHQTQKAKLAQLQQLD